MNKRSGAFVILAAAIFLLFYGCGGSSSSSGGGGGPIALSTMTVISDKAIALANGSDTVSPERIILTAELKDGSGIAISGSPISFVVTGGTGSLVNADTATNVSGLAMVQLQRNPISSPNTREDITVTATAGGVSGSKTVRFINMPAQVSVSVALNRVVTDLGALTFDLLSSPTQSAPVFSQVTPLGAAVTAPFIGPLGPGIQNTFAFAVDPSTSRYSLITSVSPGITTIMNDPLVGFSYHIDPTIKSLPTFTVTTPLAETTGAAVPIAVSQADFVVKTNFSTDK